MDSDVFELEAQFSTPDTCTDFSYQAKGVLLFEDGKITDKRRMPKSDEEDAIYRMLEASAQSALKEVGDAHAKS